MKKKSNKANLEKLRFIFFEIGIIISLSFLLYAFEWGKVNDDNSKNMYFSEGQIFEEDIIAPSIRPKEEIAKPKITAIINVVDDDNLIIAEPDFSSIEINSGDSFIPWNFNNDGDDGILDTTDFIVVEDMPLFNGGKPEIEFSRYIAKHLRYPNRAKENGVQGKVILSFVIDQKGMIDDLYVFNSAHQDLDNAALEVVKTSPKWTPGKQRGKAVRVRYYFPVHFKIN